MNQILMPVIWLAVAICCFAAALHPVSAQAPSAGDETARRRYEQGVAFMDSQKYQEAIKDFQAIVDQYPTSSVADDALVQIARYQLEVARNVDAAASAAEVLVK